MLADFTLAWRLLTTISLPFHSENPDRPAGQAATYYPLVGLILGLLLAGAAWLLAPILPPGLVAALLLALWAGLTGFLHLDGFMDSCDGLLPPRERARRLEIMKDSRVGAFGVIGVFLLLLIKFNALLTLSTADRFVSLTVSPTLARWGMTWAMARYPLARSEGVSVFFRAGLGWRQVVLASLIAAAVVLVLLGWPGALLLGVAWLTTTLVARFAMTRLAGLTGDIYGAICEITETVLLITIIGLAW